LSARRIVGAALAALAVAAVLVVVLGSGGGDPAAGQVRFLRNATSSFDRLLETATPAQQRWMRRHYWRMRGYPPAFDPALRWAPPAHFYMDLYAIYRETRSDGLPDRRVLRAHPDWVLRDRQGRPLYIPFDCSGGSCPQYAADIGSAGWRRHWIALARERLGRGYAGIHVDDTNLYFRVGDGRGRSVRPVDPRTSRPMTLAAWRGYMAAFSEQIRKALPRAEISHNDIWYAPHDDPNVQREVDAADYIELERGFTDPGIVAGAGRFGFASYLDNIDWLHSRGKGAIIETYSTDEPGNRYELAAYFLVNDGKDAIASEYRADPGNWWPAWDTDLGAPDGGRRLEGGIYRRDFERGLVLVDPPAGPTRRIDLGGTYRNTSGALVQAVTLRPGSGEVLREAGR
jgi:hypothetical protein